MEFMRLVRGAGVAQPFATVFRLVPNPRESEKKRACVRQSSGISSAYAHQGQTSQLFKFIRTYRNFMKTSISEIKPPRAPSSRAVKAANQQNCVSHPRLKPEVIAEYAPGQRPVFHDLSESSRGYRRLGNRTLISVDRLIELQERVQLTARNKAASKEIRTEFLFRPDEWIVKDNHERRLLGMGLAYLVNHGLAELKCINPHKSGTRIYRTKR